MFMRKLNLVLLYLLYLLSVLSLITTVVLALDKITTSLHDEEKRTSAHLERLTMAKQIVNYSKLINDKSQYQPSVQEHIKILKNALNNESVKIETAQRNKLANLIRELESNNKPDKEIINQVNVELIFKLMLSQETEYLSSQRDTAPLYILFDKKWSSLMMGIWVSAMFTAFLSGLIAYRLHIKNKMKKGFNER